MGTMTDVPHVPVLKEEALGFLQPGKGKRIIDGTFGFGGHSLAILETGAEVLGLDLDAVAVDTCRRISGDRHRLKCQQISFRDLDRAATDTGPVCMGSGSKAWAQDGMCLGRCQPSKD